MNEKYFFFLPQVSLSISLFILCVLIMFHVRLHLLCTRKNTMCPCFDKILSDYVQMNDSFPFFTILVKSEIGALFMGFLGARNTYVCYYHSLIIIHLRIRHNYM